MFCLASAVAEYEAKLMNEPAAVSIDYEAILWVGIIVLVGLAIGFVCFLFRHRQGFRAFWKASVTAIWTIFALLLLFFGVGVTIMGCVELWRLSAGRPS